MRCTRKAVLLALVVFLVSAPLSAHAKSARQTPAPPPKPVPVTVDNFIRAESDLYFSNVVKDHGFGEFKHNRVVTPLDKQNVIRMNRDTLYSGAVFDLDAGPVTITLPEAGARFMSMQVITEDHLSPTVAYKAGSYTLSHDDIDTRYIMVAVRILVDAMDMKDLQQAHALQDAIKVEQAGAGHFEVPYWDAVSQKKIRDALLVLGSSVPDSKQMFGTKEQISPLRHLIGSATAWGGNPETEAAYLNVTPQRNDGVTVHTLTVRDVPVDGFWSISVYNSRGYFEANKYDAYSLNSITSKKRIDGSVTVQFGGCNGKVANCLPIMRGWNYIVRLYRPHPEILTGSWVFPEAQPMK
ncbi:DUF1254 domain-containing protein [Nitrospira sp. KM1]|uniref:DUF1254 domain-containing protein n=1 Tax=Nitrospira sp. KM1 TaxID=1936990 RepID=UPI001565E279|nr:DUF1254 domain-containing protein [Nitrospira sp. KM1]